MYVPNFSCHGTLSASCCRCWGRWNAVSCWSSTCPPKTTTTSLQRLSFSTQCSSTSFSSASGPTSMLYMSCTLYIQSIYLKLYFSKSRQRAKAGKHYGGWYYGSPAYECPRELEDVFTDVMKLKQKSGESDAQLDKKRLSFHDSLTNFRRKHAYAHYRVRHTLVIQCLYWLY